MSDPLKYYVPGYRTLKHLKGWAVAANSHDTKRDAVEAFWKRQEGPTVFVWEPSGGVGHASILVDKKAGAAGGNYVSGFPGGEGISDKSSAVSRHEMAWMDFSDDCLSESIAHGDAHRLPEHVIRLPSLNVTSMAARARALRTENPRYSLLMNNCSDLVAQILRAGLSWGQLARVSYWAYTSYWTPTDVRWLAEAARDVSQ